MKIKNESVSIKIGDKHYDFNNLILDEYLKRFVMSQVDKDKLNYIPYNKSLRYCLLKFDTKIEELQEKSELNNKDFDICFLSKASCEQIINSKNVTIKYTYKTDSKDPVWDYKEGTMEDIHVSKYYGRKITAIGFNSTWQPNNSSTIKFSVCAVLDTSNYNIYLQENQQLTITRKDIIITDALFYSNDKIKVPGPAHLAPAGVPQVIYQPDIKNDYSKSSFNDAGYGILYSVGLSSYSNYIDKEFVIGKDVQIEKNGTELVIRGIENYLSKDNPIFSQKDMYSNSTMYPVKSNYKYVIFKYKVWQMVHSGTYDNVTETSTDTGYYYYQAVLIDKFGKSNIKIKYERG